jgi:hypothetical protein
MIFVLAGLDPAIHADILMATAIRSDWIGSMVYKSIGA